MQPLQNPPFCSSTVLGMYTLCYLPVLLEWRSGCRAPWWSTVWVGGWTQPTASRAAGSAPPTAAYCSYSRATTAVSHQQWAAFSQHHNRQQLKVSSQQPQSTADSLMSFGDNNSLFTECSSATAGSSQHSQRRQPLIHSCHYRHFVASSLLTTASSQQGPIRQEQLLHSSPLTATAA